MDFEKLASKSFQGVMILFNLSPGQTAIYETLVDNAPQRLGWALIEETSAGVGDMLGQTVFRKQNVGSPDFMTSHLLGFPGFERMSVFFDNTEGKYTGMGILTSDLCISVSSCTANTLRVTVPNGAFTAITPFED